MKKDNDEESFKRLTFLITQSQVETYSAGISFN